MKIGNVIGNDKNGYAIFISDNTLIPLSCFKKQMRYAEVKDFVLSAEFAGLTDWIIPSKEKIEELFFTIVKNSLKITEGLAVFNNTWGALIKDHSFWTATDDIYGDCKYIKFNSTIGVYFSELEYSQQSLAANIFEYRALMKENWSSQNKKVGLHSVLLFNEFN